MLKMTQTALKRELCFATISPSLILEDTCQLLHCHQANFTYSLNMAIKTYNMALDLRYLAFNYLERTIDYPVGRCNEVQS